MPAVFFFNPANHQKVEAESVYNCNAELCSLLINAYNQFQDQVLKKKKVYDLYAADYVNSIYYIEHTDAASLNAHNVNYHIVKELLFERRKLIFKYFYADTFTHEHCELLLHERDTLTENAPNDKTVEFSKSFNCTLNHYQFEVVHKVINRLSIFTYDLTLEEIVNLFNCKVTRPIQSKNTRLLARLFHALSSEYIVPRWMAVINFHKLILKPQGKSHLQSTDLTSAKNATSTKTYEQLHTEELKIIAQMLIDLKL